MHNDSSVRIIGGTYRGRKIRFIAENGLRPTPDRVRETLFNWLQMDIVGSKCLDLFSGSGSLAIESISRGAKQVIGIEKNDKNFSKLIENKNKLEINNLDIILTDAISYLNKSEDKFDVVFLDPPYSSDLLSDCLKLIINKKILKEDGLIYLETDKKISDLKINSEILDSLEILKDKKAGHVRFYLIRGK